MDEGWRAETRDERERGWIRAIARKDRQAFESLFRDYEGRLMRYFGRLVGDRGLAEELTSDVLFEVWKRADRFRGDSRPSTWIFGIAHHKGVSALRRRRPDEAAIEPPVTMADPAPGPERRAAAAERRRTLAEAMRDLSAEHREVLELTYLEGMTLKEIATIQGCPVATAKTRLFYARKNLRPLLERVQTGGSPP